MSSEPLFNESDLELIQSLNFDASLKPSYHPLKGCLTWNDEKIDNLSPSGYEIIGDLWIVRSYIHLDKDLKTTLDPEYFRDIWVRAEQQIPNWPGFKRLELNDEDRTYLETSLQEMSDAEKQGLEL
jgi:hypothetical protein